MSRTTEDNNKSLRSNGNKQVASLQSSVSSKASLKKTLGPVADLEKHLPSEWWKTLFNSLYIKTDGDVVENPKNTIQDVDLIIKTTNIEPSDNILDLCCGQGRHSLELARRGFKNVSGIDRSRYLIRLARKRAYQSGIKINFSEGDARKVRFKESSFDLVVLMGNSFGYFEKDEDDVAVIEEIKRILQSNGQLVLDIVDGNWMKKNFEPRSWEWIDQNNLVCRERSLSLEKSRIVTREVIVNAKEGIIADQFYAERLYTFDTISAILERSGFSNIKSHGNILSHSLRNQDLGMMANRLFITAVAPEKILKARKKTNVIPITVVMGDPTLPDSIKKGGKFNEEDLATIQKLKESLKTLGNFSFKYLTNHRILIDQLKSKKHNFVFNLCDEGFNNLAIQELHVPAILEMLNIPYSGASPATLAICYDKSIVRSIADSLNIPVPLETFVKNSDQYASLPSIFPAILKPNTGDSSIGITKDAVVYNAEELINYLDKMKVQFSDKDILIQEFLTGREFSVSVVGNPGNFNVLPILEVDYSNLPNDLPRILSYESKWLPESPYWTEIKYHKAVISEDVQRQLIDNSLILFERLNCRDYARFDFREDGNGIVKLLEVNPNPGWCWDGKFNYMASMKGIKYPELLEMVINAALERLKLKNIDV